MVKSDAGREVSAREARANFADLIGRVSYGNERIIIRRRNKPVVAVISVEDLAFLEEIEDQLDLIEAKKALQQAKKKGEKPIPWEKIRKEL